MKPLQTNRNLQSITPLEGSVDCEIDRIKDIYDNYHSRTQELIFKIEEVSNNCENDNTM